MESLINSHSPPSRIKSAGYSGGRRWSHGLCRRTNGCGGGQDHRIRRRALLSEMPGCRGGGRCTFRVAGPCEVSRHLSCPTSRFSANRQDGSGGQDGIPGSRHCAFSAPAAGSAQLTIALLPSSTTGTQLPTSSRTNRPSLVQRS